jgi:hypothetical protein
MRHDFQRRAAVQSVMRRGVVGCQHAVEQVLEFRERNEESQVALGIRQLALQILRIAAGEAGQPARQALGDGAEEALDIRAVIGSVGRPDVDEATDKFRLGMAHIVQGYRTRTS